MGPYKLSILLEYLECYSNEDDLTIDEYNAIMSGNVSGVIAKQSAKKRKTPNNGSAPFKPKVKNSFW